MAISAHNLLDRLTAAICGADESAHNKAEFEIRKSIVRDFLVKNESRLIEWVKNHAHGRPPIYYIEQEKKVVWLNRKQARKLKRPKPPKRRREPASSGPSHLDLMEEAASALTQSLSKSEESLPAPKHLKEAGGENDHHWTDVSTDQLRTKTKEPLV